MITAIIKIKDGYTIAEVAHETWEVFGRGGRSSEIIEGFLGACNTPVCNGYIRVLFDEEYAVALDYTREIDAAYSVEVISVERDGQIEYQVGTDEEGNPEYLGMIAGVGGLG